MKICVSAFYDGKILYWAEISSHHEELWHNSGFLLWKIIPTPDICSYWASFCHHTVTHTSELVQPSIFGAWRKRERGCVLSFLGTASDGGTCTLLDYCILSSLLTSKNNDITSPGCTSHTAWELLVCVSKTKLLWTVCPPHSCPSLTWTVEQAGGLTSSTRKQNM